MYMDAALQQLRKEGFEVRDEDVARLSPLGHEHINMLGRYTFSLPDKIAREAATPQESWRTPEPDFLFRCYSDPYMLAVLSSRTAPHETRQSKALTAAGRSGPRKALSV